MPEGYGYTGDVLGQALGLPDYPPPEYEEGPGSPYNLFQQQTLPGVFGYEQTPLVQDIYGRGYGNLADILASGGATSPELLAREAQTQGYGEQALIRSIQEGGYGPGLERALIGGAEAGGREMTAERRATEAEDRKRRRESDLDLFRQILLEPDLARSLTEIGGYWEMQTARQIRKAAEKARKKQKKAATIGAIMQMAGILLAPVTGGASLALVPAGQAYGAR